jgi:predicted RNase H-like HicB family nuclease
MAVAPRETSIFTVILEEEEEGFSVHCPALPGCVSQGDDRMSALANIREAIEMVLDLQPQGEPCDDSAAAVAQEMREILIAREEDGLPCAGVSIESVEVAVKAIS